MSVLRCWVKRNGELIHDQTYAQELATIATVSYPGLRINDDVIEVGFTFDPPLVRPEPAEEEHV